MPSHHPSIAPDSQSTSYNYSPPTNNNCRRYSNRRTSLAYSFRTEWSHNQQTIRKVAVKYENSYRLEPSKKPEVARIEHNLKKFLQDRLANIATTTTTPATTVTTSTTSTTTDPTTTLNPVYNYMFVARKLADDVRQYVKTLNYPRYKIVCFTAIGQDLDQGMQVSSRGLIDQLTDTWIEVNHLKLGHMFVSVLIYFIYYE